MKAFQLLDTSAKHARGNYALTDAKPNPLFTNPGINPETKICDAVKWDICGALQHCYIHEDAMIILEEIDAVARNMVDSRNQHPYSGGVDEKNHPYFGGWVTFNDYAPFADIVGVLQTVEERFNFRPKQKS